MQSQLRFDPNRVAYYERLHAALFGATIAAMHSSAQARALAAVAVDRITGQYSTDVAADWQEVYRAV